MYVVFKKNICVVLELALVFKKNICVALELAVCSALKELKVFLSNSIPHMNI